MCSRCATAHTIWDSWHFGRNLRSRANSARDAFDDAQNVLNTLIVRKNLVDSATKDNIETFANAELASIAQEYADLSSLKADSFHIRYARTPRQPSIPYTPSLFDEQGLVGFRTALPLDELLVGFPPKEHVRYPFSEKRILFWGVCSYLRTVVPPDESRRRFTQRALRQGVTVDFGAVRARVGRK